MKSKKQIPFYLFLLIALVFQPAWTNSAPPRQDQGFTGPIVSEPVMPLSSMAVSLLPETDNAGAQKEDRPRHNPLQNEPDQGQRGTWDRLNVPIDPLIHLGGGQDVSAEAATPSLLLNFDGTGNPVACDTCRPPNPNGDVGPNHYVQMVGQTKVSIYSKTGTLLKVPFDLGLLWTSGNCTGNAGSPVVLYDPMADRWVLSQIGDPADVCFAVSKTADPTGEYYLYDFPVGAFPDSLKLGVWTDGYYMSTNEAKYSVYAFDRANMLNGASATFQKFTGFTGGTNFYMPSDFDGTTPPPSGAPDYFYTFKDNNYHGGSDSIEVRAFHVDWVTPANSTFDLQDTIDIAPFTYTVCGFFNPDCIHQLGTAQNLESVSEWPMFRFPYRSFGARQSLVGAFTVGGGSSLTATPPGVGAAIRWFELRNVGGGWTLYQEGTFDPGDGTDRFMPSIAMDSIGNIALGYSASSSSIHPSIRYTIHGVNDALGTMQTEATMIAGGGSQTESNRWGSYSSLSVDPVDDLSFWYTNEYYAADSPNQWKTRIGTFKIAQSTFSTPFASIGSNDGWVLESGEQTNKGGTKNVTATTFNIGDDASKKQYRAILSFATGAGLPDDAVITKVTLKVKLNKIVGGKNPVAFFKGFLVDIKNGAFGKSALEIGDFQAKASNKTPYGPFVVAQTGGWYSIDLTGAKSYINILSTSSGLTQLRLRFKVDDNNNSIANYLKLYSGNAKNAADRPQLIVEY
jgi:hypothetical protein